MTTKPKDKYREITIDEACETQDYSHEEMADLVFIEKQAFQDLKADFDKLIETIKSNEYAMAEIDIKEALKNVKDWDL